MQLLFNASVPNTPGTIRYAGWPVIKDGITKNVQQVKHYYRTRGFAVKSNHLLCRIIDSLGVSLNLPLERYVNAVIERTSTISMSFNLSNSVHRGKVHEGIFYGESNPEIIIATCNIDNIYAQSQNWKDIVAVKPLRHNRTTLDLQLALGKDISTDNGIAVIEINVALLALQYYMFVKNEYINGLLRPGTRMTNAQFVHSFVIPNMLEIQTDLVIYNRFERLLRGQPMGQLTHRPPYVITDFYQRLDTGLKYYLENLRDRQHKDFITILKVLPTVFSETGQTLMRIPDLAPTSQYMFSELLSRVNVLDTLIRLSDDNGRRKDMTLLNYIKRYLRQLVRNNLLPNSPIKGVTEELNYDLMEISRAISND